MVGVVRKRIADTSRLAWDDLSSTLSVRAAVVLAGLRTYCTLHRTDPTSYELLRFLQRDDPKLDLNGVRPRLTELKNANCAHTTGKRRCSVTGKVAYTWATGPDPLNPIQEGLFETAA